MTNDYDELECWTKRMTVAIAPCPFCSSNAGVEEFDDVDLMLPSMYRVQCYKCFAIGPAEIRKGDAIYRWNDRQEKRSNGDTSTNRAG